MTVSGIKSTVVEVVVTVDAEEEVGDDGSFVSLTVVHDVEKSSIDSKNGAIHNGLIFIGTITPK